MRLIVTTVMGATPRVKQAAENSGPAGEMFPQRPQGLKPSILAIVFGTTNVVP